MQFLIPYGGGFDSTTLALLCSHLKSEHKLTLGHVNYGQKANLNEEHALKKLICLFETKKLLIDAINCNVDLSFSNATIMHNTHVGDTKSNMLLLRNPIIISLLCSKYLALYPDTKELMILLAFHLEPDDTPFKDALTDYLEPLQLVLSKVTDVNIKLVTPFELLSRQEIYSLGRTLCEDFKKIAYSCYEETKCVDSENMCSHCSLERTMEQFFQENSKSRLDTSKIKYLNKYISIKDF